MSSKQFGEAKISSLLFKFSIPVILSMLVGELYSMVDTFYVGRFVGGEGIGALTVVFPLQRILTAITIMIAVGTATAFSRSIGNDNIKSAKEILQSGFTMVLAVMLPVALGVFLFRDSIVTIMGAGEAISAMASTYLGTIIFGTVFLSITVFISHTLIALGNTKISIISTSIGAIVNLILDIIFVQNMGMGIQGAAIATAASQMIGFGYAFYKYSQIRKTYDISIGLKIKKSLIMPILIVGVSAFIIEAEDGILMGVLSSLLANSAGDQGIVVLGVVSKLYMFLFITIFGIASAMQPIAAYNIGAGNFIRLKKLMKKTIVYSIILTSGLWIFMMIFAPYLIGIFIQDNSIIVEATRAFRIMIALFPVISVYYVSIFYFQARGKAKSSIMIAVLRQLILMIPVSILLVKGFGMGANGVWLSYPISDILSSLASYMLIRNEGMEINIAIAKEKRDTATKGLALR